MCVCVCVYVCVCVCVCVRDRQREGGDYYIIREVRARAFITRNNEINCGRSEILEPRD